MSTYTKKPPQRSTLLLLKELLPFGLAFNRFFEIVDMGPSIDKIFTSSLKGHSLKALFTINNPKQVNSFEDILLHKDQAFTLQSNNNSLELRGSMKWLGEADIIFFACSPVIHQISEFEQYNLLISDFAHHDQVPNFLFAMQAQNNYITEIDILSKQLNAQRKELKRSNEELQSFAYVASHDLKTPLRTITGFAQLIRRKHAEAISEEGRELFDHLIVSTKRMNELVSDLLNFSRLNTIKPEYTLVSINLILNDVLNDLKVSIEEIHALVAVKPLPIVSCDKKRIYQVLSNLINNAIKFRRSTVTPKIEVGSKMEQGSVTIYVKDNGIGIDPIYQTKIFQMFERLHHNDEYEGTGIGLSICKKIIDNHAGKIWFESKLGVGSTFFFSIGNQ